jgi:hypothetical protein
MSKQDDEFGRLYRFLLEELPKHFNKTTLEPKHFGVGDEFDEGEFVSSFLMPHDAYNDSIPAAIREFLRTLEYDWAVYGSFDIVEPFAPDGRLNPSPRFQVTKLAISGDTDIDSVRRRYGATLRNSIA